MIFALGNVGYSGGVICRFDWMDRWLWSSWISIVSIHDGHDCVQDRDQLLAALVSDLCRDLSVGLARASTGWWR